MNFHIFAKFADCFKQLTAFGFHAKRLLVEHTGYGYLAGWLWPMATWHAGYGYLAGWV